MIAPHYRIGAVSYLNTRPLVHGLRHRLEGIGSLSFNLPSRLADQLAGGQLDVALIPSVEYFLGGQGDYQILSDAAIACQGPVWSVRLLSRVPLPRIRTLALDVGSRTSAALVRLLLWQEHGIRPQTLPLAMEQLPEAVAADAVLLIGDRAMHPPAGVYQEIVDLGQWWTSLTGLPFVFAMWVARSGVDCERLDAALRQSRDEGCRQLRAIAATEAGPHGLTISDVWRYFTEHLRFHLGPDQLTGLQAFHTGLVQMGMLTERSAGHLPATQQGNSDDD